MKTRGVLRLFSIHPCLAASHGQSIITIAPFMPISSIALGVDEARYYVEGPCVRTAADKAALAAVTQSAGLSVRNLASDGIARNRSMANGVHAGVIAQVTK